MLFNPGTQKCPQLKKHWIFSQIFTCLMNHIPQLILCPSIWLPKHLLHKHSSELISVQNNQHWKKASREISQICFYDWCCHEVPLKAHGWLFLSLWKGSSSSSRLSQRHMISRSLSTNILKVNLSEQIFRWRVVSPWEYTRPQRAFLSHCFITNEQEENYRHMLSVWTLTIPLEWWRDSLCEC